jgi:HSP20 family protein
MNTRSMAPSTAPSSNGGSRMAVPTLLGSLHREIDRLIDDFARGNFSMMTHAQANLVPQIDVAETDNEIEITVELPGLERKDVEISVEDDMLTIRGEKKIETKENEADKKNYHVSERSYGVFLRMVQLPAGVDPASIQATMSNGVLKLTIPKPAKAEPKKIEVKEAA